MVWCGVYDGCVGLVMMAVSTSTFAFRSPMMIMWFSCCSWLTNHLGGQFFKLVLYCVFG